MTIKLHLTNLRAVGPAVTSIAVLIGLLALLLLPVAAFALDNATRFTPVSAVTAVPMSFGKVFIDGEIPSGKFPAPYLSGTILATWQVDQIERYPSGAVKRAIVSFPLTASALSAVEYRPHDNPCSSGNQAACDAAALNQAGMLAFNGGTWAASATLTANPQGSTTARTFDARAALNAGRWRYRLRGPAVTQVVVGDTSTSRADDFGWAEHRVKMLAVQVDNASVTSVTVNDATGWASIARPFEIAVGGGDSGAYERMLVCFVNEATKVLTIGNSNGGSSACANTNGRNVGGTSATYHTLTQHGTYVFLRDGAMVLTENLVSVVPQPACNDVGSTDDYACTASPAITVPYANQAIAVFRANTANTGGATLALNGGAVAPLLTSGGAALSTNAILAGRWVRVMYSTTFSAWLVQGTETHPSYAGRIAVDDATAVGSAVKRLQVGYEELRACNRDANDTNVITWGTGAWGCANSDAPGRAWRGSNIGFGNGSYYWTAGVPVRVMDSITDRWIDAPDDRFKSVHPEAVLTFPTGWAGVGVRFGFEVGTWTDRMQDQIFDVSISVGGSTVATKTGVKGSARTQLLFPVQHHALNAYWAGTTPGEVRIDHNLRHCATAGFCLQDPDLPVTTGSVNTMLTNIYQSQSGQAPAWTSANNDKCEADTATVLEGSYRDFFGFSIRSINAPGGRDELGPVTKPAAMWMYSWAHADANNTTATEMIRAQPACQGKIPYKYREHNNTRTFCDGWAYTANTNDKACTGANLSVMTFGRPLSIVAYSGIGPQNQNLTRNSADYRYPVGAATGNGFVATISGSRSHNPALSYWTALFTGDYFDQDIAMHQGFVAMTQGNDYINWTAASNSGGSRSRERGTWAWPNADDGVRKPAWIRRDAFMGWTMAEPGSPEKELLGKYLERLAAMWEGMYNITTGRYYSACPGDVDTTRAYDHSPWCWGRAWPGFGSPIGNFPSEPGVGGQAAPGVAKANRMYGYTSGFMVAYDLIACAQMVRGGAWMFDRICPAYGAGWITRRTSHPIARPHILANYQIPDRTCDPEGQDVASCSSQTNTIGRQQGFASFQNWMDSWQSSALSDYATPMNSATDLQSGYALLIGQTACLWANADDTATITGRRSCDWWRSNLKGQETWPTNPHWIYALRVPPTVATTAGDTTARVMASTRYAACKIALSASAFGSQDDSGDAAAVMLGAGRVDHVFTGLTAGTTYAGRLTCGPTRTFFSLTTTASAGGATTIAISSKAPAGATSILVEHGASDSLGSSDTGSCSGGLCSASIAAQTGRARFIRITYRDAGNAAIVQSQTYRRIP